MKRILTTVALGGAVALGSFASQALAETKVTIHLDWLFNGYHAAFFVAKDKGWYKSAGLDVTIRPGRGSSDSVRAVSAGNAQFGFPDAATAVKAISAGAKLKMVAVFLQETPMGIVSYADKNITKPKDLVGRSLSNVPIASTAVVLPAFLKRNGVDISKVKLVNHTFATAVPAVITDKVDAGQGYVFGEYLAIKAAGKGRKVNWISFAANGIQMYSNGIAANADFLKANPAATGAFVKASIRGLDWTIKNPKAAIDIMAKSTPTKKETLLGQLQEAIPLMNNADAKKNGLGSMTAAKWKATQDIMMGYGGQKKRVPAAEAWSAEYLK